jgi:glycosyltransferase involved in cell wall biosynthesis
MTKKKIIISCSSSLSLINFRGKLISELNKNHDVYVFTPKIESAKIKKALDDLNVIIIENNLIGSNVSIKNDLIYFYKLYKCIKSVKPDVFFSYTFKPVIYGSIIASLCGVKTVAAMITGLGNNISSDKSSKVQLITKKLLKFSLNINRNIKIIFQNNDDKNTLMNENIISSKNNTYVVNGSGVDLSHYEYSQPDTSNISFIMIARLINAKGIREYYEAAEQIKSVYPNTTFRLIGSQENNIDSISSDLLEKIKANNIIEYIGRTEDVRPYINSSTIVVLPSFYGEGVPRSLLEGLSMGRPIITTNSVGCKETIDPSNPNGFLIPIKNTAVLKEKMEWYINNPDEILIHGMNGRRYAEKKFDVNIINRDLINIISN